MEDSTAEDTDRYTTYALVRRLLITEAMAHWPRYVLAFAMMAIAASATALTAYLLGTMTNEAYVNRNYHGIVVIGLIAMVIFAAKGFATYGATVTLSSIGNRIIELPQDDLSAESRDPRVGFVAHVPTGSLKKGENIVTTGGGKAVPCAICHGPDLKGLGDVPPIIGRSPMYIYRQLNDIKIGTRNGAMVPLMKGVVEKLTDDDMIAIAAYLVSKTP